MEKAAKNNTICASIENWEIYEIYENTVSPIEIYPNEKKNWRRYCICIDVIQKIIFANEWAIMA